MRQESFFILSTLAGVAALYMWLAGQFSNFHAFWSPDSGARFAMIQNWMQHGSLTSLVYDWAAADPTGRLHPLPVYVLQGPKGLSIMYPPFFTGLCGFAFRTWGFGGLTVLPLASGIAALQVTYLTAKRLGLRCRAWLPLVMGLATPVVVYSIVFWEHSLIMLLAAGTAFFLLRALQTKRLFFAVAAGATLGVGIWVQELLLFLFAAIFLAALPLLGETTGRRLVLGMVSTFSVLLVLWLASNQALYGFWGGAHMMMGVHWVADLGSAGTGQQGNALHSGLHSGLRQGLKFGPVGARALLELAGTGQSSRAGLFFLLLLGAIPPSAQLQKAASNLVPYVTPFLMPLLYVAACAAGVSLVRYGVFASGLFEVTPVLIPALAMPWFVTKPRNFRPVNVRLVSIRSRPIRPLFQKSRPLSPNASKPERTGTALTAAMPETEPPDTPETESGIREDKTITSQETIPENDIGEDESREHDTESADTIAFYAWMSRACWLFCLLLIVNPVPPGLDWGSRYLLTVLPFLVLLSARALETQGLHYPVGRFPGRQHKLRGTVAALTAASLVGASLVCQCCGLAAVRDDLAYSRNLNVAARALSTSTLVTDITWLGPEIAASQLPEKQAFVGGDQDRRFLLSILGQEKAREFAFMGTPAGCAALARDASQADVPFRSVALWNGLGLQFARFSLQPARVPRTRHVLALYYPWYGTPARGGRWLHQEPDMLLPKKMADHAHFPVLGPYDSTDPAVIERHLQQAQAAGIDTLVCSWWGRTDRTDQAIRLLLRRAAAHSLKVCVLWEQSNPQEKLAETPKARSTGSPAGKAAHDKRATDKRTNDKPLDEKLPYEKLPYEKLPDDKLSAARSDLAYLLNTLAKNPAYLRDAGKPVVFLYSGVSQGLPLRGWVSAVNEAARQVPPGVELIGTGQSPADLLVCDGFFALTPDRSLAGSSLENCARIQSDTYRSVDALAREAGGVRVETVLPGIDDRRVDDGVGMLRGTLVDRRGGALYRALWEQTLRDGPDWVLVNSFNQWHAGTEIEPSLEMGDAYLALTRQFARRFKAPPVRDKAVGTSPAGSIPIRNLADRPVP